MGRVVVPVSLMKSTIMRWPSGSHASHNDLETAGVRLVHLLLPGGRWQTAMASSVATGELAISSTFQGATHRPLEPSLRICAHQPRDEAANFGSVSLSFFTPAAGAHALHGGAVTPGDLSHVPRDLIEVVRVASATAPNPAESHHVPAETLPR